MEYKEEKKQVLLRVPPGDKWKPFGIPAESITFDSLTDGLEWCYQQTGCRDYHLAALDGKVYTIDQVEKAPEPPKQFTLYGE